MRSSDRWRCVWKDTKSNQSEVVGQAIQTSFRCSLVRIQLTLDRKQNRNRSFAGREPGTGRSSSALVPGRIQQLATGNRGGRLGCAGAGAIRGRAPPAVAGSSARRRGEPATAAVAGHGAPRSSRGGALPCGRCGARERGNPAGGGRDSGAAVRRGATGSGDPAASCCRRWGGRKRRGGNHRGKCGTAGRGRVLCECEPDYAEAAGPGGAAGEDGRPGTYSGRGWNREIYGGEPDSHALGAIRLQTAARELRGNAGSFAGSRIVWGGMGRRCGAAPNQSGKVRSGRKRHDLPGGNRGHACGAASEADAGFAKPGGAEP